MNFKVDEKLNFQIINAAGAVAPMSQIDLKDAAKENSAIDDPLPPSGCCPCIFWLVYY